MYIIEEMRLNKFVPVDIPSPRSYFQRLGAGTLPASQYSGDESIPSGNKVDNLAYMDQYDKMKQKEESSKTD